MSLLHAGVLALLLGSASPAGAMNGPEGGTDLAPPASLPTGDSGTLKAKLAGWDRPATALPLEQDSSDQPIALRKPLSAGYLTSSFGVRSDPMTGRTRAHRGMDIAARHGSPIFASESGVVSLAGRLGGYGNLVQIDHGDGIQTRYGHMARILVRPGEEIRAGDLIGLVGSTGRSTGSHLHFEVRVDGAAVDPARPLHKRFRTAAARPTIDQQAVPLRWQGWSAGSDRLPSAF